MNTSLIVRLGMLTAIFPVAALAYLDPGTGSMVLQVLVGGLLAGAALLRTYWTKVRSFFGGGGDKTSDADTTGKN